MLLSRDDVLQLDLFLSYPSFEDFCQNALTEEEGADSEIVEYYKLRFRHGQTLAKEYTLLKSDMIEVIPDKGGNGYTRVLDLFKPEIPEGLDSEVVIMQPHNAAYFVFQIGLHRDSPEGEMMQPLCYWIAAKHKLS